MPDHHFYMAEALAEAERAFQSRETPVGAVVVKGDRIIGRSHNLVESVNDPSNHAEIIAMAQAREYLDSKFLNHTTLYVTLEPCPMCATAAILHRVERIVFGAYDIRWGACGTLYDIPGDERLNHKIEIIGGIMEEECSKLLKKFFKGLR